MAFETLAEPTLYCLSWECGRAIGGHLDVIIDHRKVRVLTYYRQKVAYPQDLDTETECV